MKQILLFAATLSMSWLGATSAQAALAMIYTTEFNTPTYSDAALIGQDGWLITGTSVVNPLAVTGSATNGTVAMANNGQDVNRALGVNTNSGSIYLKATFTISAAQATGDYFLHLGDGGSSNFNARIYAKSSGAGYQMALGTGAGTATYGTTVLSLGTQIVLLARYDFVPGALNDTGALFINPTTEDGSGDTPYVVATTIGTDAVGISSVNLRQGTAANAPTLIIDSLTVLVPEPSSAMLLLGMIGLVSRRKR